MWGYHIIYNIKAKYWIQYFNNNTDIKIIICSQEENQVFFYTFLICILTQCGKKYDVILEV